jgi:hypothetical protein
MFQMHSQVEIVEYELRCGVGNKRRNDGKMAALRKSWLT